MKLRNLDIYDKYLLIFCIFFSIFIVLTYPFSPPSSDNGMHLTISLFYHDLTHFVLENGFSGIFNYAINYLVHYPKLTVNYPPLYHFIISMVFNLSTSVLAARLVTLFFALGTIITTFKLTEFLINKKTALLTSIFLGVAPVFVINSRVVMMTIPLLFFSLLTFYVYLRAFEKNNTKLFILAGFLLALAFLTKWMGLIVIPVMFTYWFFRGRNFDIFKKFMLSLIIALLVLSPYLYLYKTYHLHELTIKAAYMAGFAENDPQFTELAGWLYYPQKLIAQLSIPIGILALIFTGIYIYRKEKNWKLIGIWIFVTYMIFTFIVNKDIRYTVFYLTAFLMPLSFYLTKKLDKSKVLYFLIAALVAFSAFTAYGMIPKFSTPYPEITNYIYNNTKGNIAFISESNEMVASTFIFNMLRLDRNLTLSVSRPCIFDAKKEEIKNILRENNIYYLIYVPGGAWSENFNKFDNIELVKDFGKFQLYRVKNFKYIEKNYTCNYICRVKDWICNNMTYKEIFSRGIFSED